MDDPLRHWEGQARRVRRRRDYIYPQFPHPSNQAWAEWPVLNPPKVSTKRFPALPKKPPTRERIEKLALPLAQEGGARSPEILAL